MGYTKLKKADKPKRTRAELSVARARAGRAGAAAVHGYMSPAKVEKIVIRDHLDQRLMRATDKMINGQISLAVGQQFLYRIDKEWNRVLNKFVNQKPVLVESQLEIEAYLQELADNNGVLEDDKDGGAAYYYITTKEPSIQAIDSAFNRVHGKARESLDVNQHHTFSLLDLHKQRRTMIDGNADTTIMADVPMIAPARR